MEDTRGGGGGEISRQPMDMRCSVLYIIYKFRIQGYTRQHEVPCSRIQHRIPGEDRIRDLMINLSCHMCKIAAAKHVQIWL